MSKETEYYEEIPPADDNQKPDWCLREKLPPIVLDAESEVIQNFAKNMGVAAECGCTMCRGMVYTAMDWLTYPETIEKAKKQEMWDKAVNEAKAIRIMKRLGGRKING